MKRIAAALMLACISFAATAGLMPLVPTPNLTPGVDTGVYGEQTCPPPIGCVETGNTVLHFNIIGTPGSMALAFIGVVDPSTSGFYSFDVEVFDPLNNLIASGINSPNLLIPSFNVLIGNNYTINVDWAFSGSGLSQTASWALVAATSVNKVSEPSTVLLLGLGLMVLGALRLRRQA